MNDDPRWMAVHTWDDHTSSVDRGRVPFPQALDGMYLDVVEEHDDMSCEEGEERTQRALVGVHGGMGYRLEVHVDDDRALRRSHWNMTTCCRLSD
jgi:hypothetical protein